MKKILKMLSVFLSTVIAVPIMAIPNYSSEAVSTISISPYNTYEINNGVFEGWGTSLCWWANRIGYSDSLSQQAAEAFFGDDGLRMNIVRYNIGGGDDPTHDHITRTDSNMPGYTKFENGKVSYDWTADSNQRNVLMKALEVYGDDLIVEMFSNSPPYYMTESGCSSGGTNPGVNNLKDDYYDDFADYLAEVSAHFKNDWGVNIQSIDAMNEPYTNYWFANSAKQEGCHFDQGESQTKIILELQRAMKERGLDDVILSGTDETSIDTQISSYNALSDKAKNALGRIDTHTYAGSQRTELKNLAISANKNLWMSEVDGGATAGENAGEMGSALWLANRMTYDCNELNCSAWILWQAIDNHISKEGYNGNQDKGMVDTNGGFWGLAVADHDNNNIIFTKKYYVFGQYSRYIRPGMTMLKSSGSTLAAYDEKNNRLVVVAKNDSGSASEIQFDLSQFDSVGDTAQAIRTSNTENWKNTGDVKLSGENLNASLAANSVTTFIIDNVTSQKIEMNQIKLSSDMISGSDAWHQSSNDYTKAFDGDASTYFDGVGGGWVQADLGAVYDIKAIGYAPRTGYEQRCTDGMFMVSEDGVNWRTIYTINNKPASGMHYITKFSGSTSARYVRYQVPEGKPSNEYNKDSVYCCNIAEIAIYGDKDVKPNDFGWYFNNGFEDGTDGWIGRGGAAIEKSGKTHYVGGNSLYVSGRTAYWHGAQKSLSTSVFKPGDEYSFSANVKYTNGSATDTFCMKLQYVDVNGDMQYSTIAETMAIKDEWVQLANTNFKIPSDATDMYLYIETADTDNSFYLDEVIGAVGGTGILGAGSQKIIRGDVNFDGVINCFDVILAKRGYINSFNSVAAQVAADVDQSGVVDKTDIILIQNFLVVKITKFPVAEKPHEPEIEIDRKLKYSQPT